MGLPASYTTPLAQTGSPAVQMETHAVGGSGQAAAIFQFGGNLYQVLQGLAGSGGTVTVGVFKSTNGGASWGQLDSANAPTKSSLPSGGLYFDGAHTLTIAYTLGDVTVPIAHPVVLIDFNLSTGLWGAPYGAGSADVYGINQIYKRSDASLVAIVLDNTNSIALFVLSGGSWSSVPLDSSFPGGWVSNLSSSTVYDTGTDTLHMFGIAFSGIHKKQYYQQISLSNTVSGFQDLTALYLAAGAMGNPLIVSGNLLWGVIDPTDSFATILKGTPLASPVFSIAASPGVDPTQPIPSGSPFTLQPTLATDGTNLWAVVVDNTSGEKVRLSITSNISNPVTGWTSAIAYTSPITDGIQYPTLSIIGGLPYMTFQQNPSGSGQPSNQFFSGAGGGALSLGCGNPPSGEVGVSYTTTFAATGGTPAYTYGLLAGAFPPGLTLNPATGVLSGTPTTRGLYTFTVEVTDSLGATANTGNCSIAISVLFGLYLYGVKRRKIRT